MTNFITSRSRTTEVSNVAMRILNVLNETPLKEDIHFQKIIENIESISSEITTAINRSRVESELEEKDNVRDEKLRDVHYLLNGMLHFPDNKVREAALKVASIYKKYGVSVVTENYATESSFIVSLLEELKLPELQNSIGLMPGFAESIMALRNAQDDFELAFSSYNGQRVKASELLNASELKRKLIKEINGSLLKYLKVMETINNSAYRDVTLQIDEIIERNNEKVNRRKNTNNTLLEEI